MLYGGRETLEDEVLRLVMPAAKTVLEVQKLLTQRGREVSLRGVYKAIDSLIDSGVLLKAGKRVRVDEEWLRKVRRGLEVPVQLPLGEGERAEYRFTSLTHLDAFWTTIAFQLESYERDQRIFFYNPHNFWVHIPERKVPEDEYYAHFEETKRHAFFTIGGEYVADREFKREYQDEYLQIDTRVVSTLPRTDHITILGDFVITVRISITAAARIDQLYAANKPFEEFQEELREEFRSRFTTRFIFEHNPKKAQKLQRLLAKNFYFKDIHQETAG